MKRLLTFVYSKEWAMTVAILTALLAESPAIIEAVQGELDSGKWTPIGLVVLVAGFVTRSNVWRRARAEELEKAKADADLRLLGAIRDADVARGKALAADAVLEATRNGTPVPMVSGGQQPQQPDELAKLQGNPLATGGPAPVPLPDEDGDPLASLAARLANPLS